MNSKRLDWGRESRRGCLFGSGLRELSFQIPAEAGTTIHALAGCWFGCGGVLCHRYAVPRHWEGWVDAVPWVGTHGYCCASPTGFRRESACGALWQVSRQLPFHVVRTAHLFERWRRERPETSDPAKRFPTNLGGRRVVAGVPRRLAFCAARTAHLFERWRCYRPLTSDPHSGSLPALGRAD